MLANSRSHDVSEQYTGSFTEHLVNEREDGIAFVPTIWKSGTTALGSPSVGAGVLCQYNLTGRGKDREVRLVVGKARKTS